LTADRRRLLEIGGRVVFVLIVLRVFPDVFWSDVHYWWVKMNHLGLHALPYRDFVWEFPPLTVLPMVPATFLRHAVSVFTVIFATLMALAEYASLELLRARWPERARSLSRFWYAVVIPLSTVAYFRFDYVPVLFTVLALLAIERGRSPATAVALGFATKLWPVVVGIVLVIERRYRELAISMAAVVAVLIGWYAFSPSGFHDFLRFRRGDGFQVESSVGAVALLAGARPTVDFGSWVVGLGSWRWVDPVTTAAWLVLAGATTVAARRRRYDPWLVIGGLVLTLMLASRLFSPQFLAWGLPFVAAGWARDEHVAGVAFGAAVVISVVNLFAYESLLHGNVLFDSLGVIRNMLIAVAGVRLLVVGLRVGAVPARSRPMVPAAVAVATRR
jgi:hypothetical protein